MPIATISFFSFFLFLNFCTSLCAQGVKIERISTEKGLSHSRVSTLLQDHQGFMWFGTYDGLNRYDGYSFNVYRKKWQDSTSLSGSAIKTLYEDTQHILWVGTDGSGLNRFDRETNSFTRYQHNPGDSSSLSHDDVYAMVEDNEGNLWIGTWGGGLNKLNRRTGKFKRYQHNPDNPNSLSDNYVRDMMKDSSGKLWIGTSYGGLNLFDPATERFIHYRHDPADPASISNFPVLAIEEGEKGVLWLSTDGGGLHRFNTKTGEAKKFLHDPNNPNSLSDNNMSGLYRDKKGMLWIGTWGGGLDKFNPQTNTFEHYKYDPLDPNSLSSNIIWRIYEDAEGLLWVSTNTGGVNKLNRHTTFQALSHNPLNSNSLSGNSVRAISEDSRGVLWIGTNGYGLNQYNKATGKFTHYLPDTTNPFSLASDIVLSLAQSRDGSIWVGTFEGGLQKLDPITGRFKSFTGVFSEGQRLAENKIMTLYEDPSGMLWVGTYESGLASYNPNTRQFTTYSHDLADPSTLSSNAVRAIVDDGKGNLWIGTLGGLNLFNKITGKCVRFLHHPQQPNSLSSDRIRCIYVAENGIVWMGTDEGGLNRFDPTKGVFTSFTEKDGLPSNVILGIIEDAKGNLWMSTNAGICSFDPQQNTFRIYDTYDGLPGNEFNIGAFHKGNSGIIYFGGLNGLAFFDPRTVKQTSVSPRVAITDFKVFDKSQREQLYTSPIRLSYKDNFFSFEFAALSFKAPQKNRYAYKLEGFDKDWIYSDNRHYASYTNLDGGKYIFRVKAMSSDGVWSEPGTSVKLHISPPFWATWWFRILGMTSLFLAVFILYKKRIESIKEQKQKLEELVLLRTEELKQKNSQIERKRLIIQNQRDELQQKNQQLEEALNGTQQQKQEAENMRQLAEEANQFKSELLSIAAHDLKNPLAGIIMYTELIKQCHTNPAEVVKLSTVIKNASFSMFRLISNLLNTVRIEANKLELTKKTIDFSLLTEEIVSRNLVQAQQKQQQLLFEEGSFCHVPVDIDLMEEAVENLISNAIKYSPPGKSIWISVKRINDNVLLQIKDEGMGLNQADLQQLFIKFRKLSTDSPKGYSTGLGLSIVQKIVGLHNGKVWAESEGVGRGCTFFVILPMQAGYEFNNGRLASEDGETADIKFSR